MINIIGNSCVASNITLDILKQKFINPFCWNIIDYISFGYLIKNYNTINFNNIELKFNENTKRYTLIIDNNINVYYEHYIEDINEKEILKKNNNVYYSNIKEYILKKYKNRLKLNNKPIFVIGSTWEINKEKYLQFEYIIKNNINKYPLIVIVNLNSDFEYLKKYENEFTKIYKTDLYKDNTTCALNIYEEYKDIFISNDDGDICNEQILIENKNKKVE